MLRVCDPKLTNFTLLFDRPFLIASAWLKPGCPKVFLVRSILLNLIMITGLIEDIKLLIGPVALLAHKNHFSVTRSWILLAFLLIFHL
ncbi:hypothetical protein Trydic_g586 [Trypoxylus dichotomus]